MYADIAAPEGTPEKEYQPIYSTHKVAGPLEILGRNLKARRIHSGLTVEAFAKKMGISIETYRGIADGTGNPTYETLLRIAIALCISIHIAPPPRSR